MFNPPSTWLISDRVLVPLGILYLSSYLREKDIDVNLIDLSGGVYKTDYEIPQTDFYGIGFTTPQFVYAEQILKKIKQQQPKARVLAGGIHATSLPQETLAAGFDVVVRGEGEEAVERIIKEGLKEKIYDTSYIKDLNSLPFPAWDLLDMNSYVSNLDVMGYMDGGNVEEREINMMGTRGCYGVCAYCSQFKGNLRWRAPENILDEIQELKEKYGINRIGFCDDNLVIDKKWLGNLCGKLKEDGVKWHCLGRADQVTYDTCKTMVDSGCMGMDFGIESGSQKVLDVIKKQTTVEKQERGIREAHDAGIKVRAQFMVGLPQETEEDHQMNLEFITRNNPYVAKWGIHVFIPYPSCELWHHPERFEYTVNKNTDFSNFQTIGKPGEWNFIPAENQEVIERRRDEILNLINEKNIFVKE